MAATVLLASQFVAASIGTNLQQPAATTRDGNFITLNRYVQEPPPDIVLVGSSVGWRLKEENFLLPRVRNLALAGGSAITGLQIVARQVQLPKIILIETDILSRLADDALVKRFAGGERPHTLLRPIRTAVAAYETWNHPPPAPADVRASLEDLLKQPPSGFDNRVYVERAVKEMNAEDATPRVPANVLLIRQLVAEVEQRGARAFLIELPLASDIERTNLIRTTRAIVHESFPDPARWLRIDAPRAELRWADGVHLDERSALIVARAIEKALAGQ
ncbi:hypothetical protein [Bradyrhizobium guangdongense]|uniref:hypothetical protein n=1 Tax=Bradyrhizobium guangdongense TaxID=1325090 RepID=UPI00112A2FBA|nr:hypothetical protein [Bradyrhizobium guangdongense]